jgi:hypothetical protein
MTTEQQTAADPRAPAGEEATSEQPDLDKLLAEYEDGKKQREAQKDTLRAEKVRRDSTLDAVKPIIEFAQGEMTRKAQADLDEDLSNAFGVLKEAEGLKAIDDSLLLGFMEAYAKDNKSFRTAFEIRRKEPEVWQQQLVKGREWLEKTIQKSFAKTSDVEAATAAVKGTSEPETAPEKGPDPMDMFHMSDSDFRRLKEKELKRANSGA